MSAISVRAGSSDATMALGAKLASACRSGDCVLLCGDLGAGKTTFARGFIQALAPGEGEVVSPTFTLVQMYQASDSTPIRHFDLYRLRHAQELEELGLDEALESGITLIEWPEIAQHALPADALTVTISTDAGDGRTFTFSGAGAWDARLKAVMS